MQRKWKEEKKIGEQFNKVPGKFKLKSVVVACKILNILDAC